MAGSTPATKLAATTLPNGTVLPTGASALAQPSTSQTGQDFAKGVVQGVTTDAAGKVIEQGVKKLAGGAGSQILPIIGKTSDAKIAGAAGGVLIDGALEVPDAVKAYKKDGAMGLAAQGTGFVAKEAASGAAGIACAPGGPVVAAACGSAASVATGKVIDAGGAAGASIIEKIQGTDDASVARKMQAADQQMQRIEALKPQAHKAGVDVQTWGVLHNNPDVIIGGSTATPEMKAHAISEAKAAAAKSGQDLSTWARQNGVDPTMLNGPSAAMPVSTPATLAPTSTFKSAATNITQLGQIGTQVATLKSDTSAKGITNVPQDIKATQQAVGTFIESKMPSTDSWLYKNTGFVDSAAAQKLVKPSQTALTEAGKIAPTASTTGTLIRDMAGLKVDKVPQDIAKSQAAMTDYFAQKMPNTDSLLYKATGFVDNPTVQKVAKFDQAALTEVGKIAPTVSTAGTLARDVAGFKVDKLPQDIVKSQAAMTDYFTQKMPSTDSWLYKNTNFIDNPTVQKIAKVDQAALTEVGKIAPVSTSAGGLARDVASLQVTKLPQDIVDTRKAMTTYFTDKMPSTDSWLYKSTNILDKPIVQKFVKADEAMLDSVAKLAPSANKATGFIDTFKSLGSFF